MMMVMLFKLTLYTLGIIPIPNRRITMMQDDGTLGRKPTRRRQSSDDGGGSNVCDERRCSDDDDNDNKTTSSNKYYQIKHLFRAHDDTQDERKYVVACIFVLLILMHKLSSDCETHFGNHRTTLSRLSRNN